MRIGAIAAATCALLMALAAAAPAATPPSACTRAISEEEASAPVAALERTRAVEALADMVDRLYLDRPKASAVAASLRKKLARGGYDGDSDPKALAAALSSDLVKATGDQHFRVRSRIVEATPAIADAKDDASARKARFDQFRREAAYDGYGLSRVEILPGNVGYLRVEEFWDPAVSGPAFAGAMNALARTDALIIDLRDSYGGHEGLAELLMGYLLDRQALLFVTTNRLTGETEQHWSQAFVPGERVNSSAPVYVLISHRKTFSAAEMLALVLRQHRSAILVGETTRGGAHGGDFRPISCRFDAFVPYYTATAGGVDWEGVGVAPDIRTPEASALDVAYAAALASLTQTPADDAFAKEVREERLADLAKLKEAPLR